jgi:hypothetical protein
MLLARNGERMGGQLEQFGNVWKAKSGISYSTDEQALGFEEIGFRPTQ